MAKLHSYYGLCSIIDQYSLLGIAEDCEKGHAIVTLGKNICIKYRIADQKQINSWRTKDKYSSPVLYDWHTEKYVAAFNQSYLRVWDKDEEQIDKQKKFKFNNTIHTLISHLHQTFIVFTNGLIYELNAALDQRKTMNSDGIVKDDSYISDLLYTNVENDIYIGLIIANDNTKEFYWKKFTNKCLSEFANFKLQCSNNELVGYMFNKPNQNEDVALLTIWSNAKLYMHSLYKEMTSPGVQYSIIESLSSEFFITMLPLDQDYIAMYGADKNGEGATLILYNLQFKLVQSKQVFKMFKNQAKIWQIDNNLLMCVGQNLAVVPFKLETEQLAALVGSHKATTFDKDQDLIIKQEVQIDSWEENKMARTNKHVPLAIKDKLNELTYEGCTDVTICEELIPELIEENNVKGVKSCLTFFCDIPDSCIAKILKFILNANESHFKVIGIEKDVFIKPKERRKMLDLLLQLSFNNLNLIPYVRKILNVTDVLLLLRYIMYLLTDDEETVPLSYEMKLIDWSCLLLDANYQKFILVKDKEVVEFLKSFDTFIKQYLTKLEEIEEAVPHIRLCRKSKESASTKNVSYINYSIENIVLF